MNYGAATANELAAYCADVGNQAAWIEFVRRFQRPIALAILRTARRWGTPTLAQVDDLVQEVFLLLCANNCRLLRDFVPLGPDSILGFLTTIAQRHTSDHLRTQVSQKRGGDMQRLEPAGTDGVDLLPAPAHQADAVDRELQLGELDRRLRALPAHMLSERDRTIFWLYYRSGYSAREIGNIKTFGLTEKGVESSIRRTTRLLRDDLGPVASSLPPLPGGPPGLPKGNVPPSAIGREGR